MMVTRFFNDSLRFIFNSRPGGVAGPKITVGNLESIDYPAAEKIKVV